MYEMTPAPVESKLPVINAVEESGGEVPMPMAVKVTPPVADTRLAVWACRHRLPRERGFLPGLFDFNLMSELKQSLLFCLAGSLIYVGMPTQPACL